MQPPPEAAYQGRPKRATSLTGSHIAPDYRMRRITYYPVDSGDMDSLTHINTEMSICLALGTLFLGALASLWITLAISPPTDTRVTNIFDWFVTPLLLVLVIVSGIGTWYCYRRRDTVTNQIYSESGGRSVDVLPAVKKQSVADPSVSNTAGSQQ
jgi:hypothetical protein